jgi:hypothetical protein
MNDNPILLKDTLLSSRGLFLPLLISITNLVLLILLIGNLYYISLNGVQTGEIRYSAFLQSYYLVGAGLFLFLLLLAPAITVSSLSIEEQNMLELLLGTELDSRSIILGKLYAELSTLITLLFSTLPFLATVYIYGGIPNFYLLLYFLSYFLSCIFLSSLGIACSGITKNSAYASILAYGISFFTYALLFYGLYSLWESKYFFYGIFFFFCILSLLSFVFLWIGRKSLEVYAIRNVNLI